MQTAQRASSRTGAGEFAARPWHTLTGDEAMRALDTMRHGLHRDEAARRRDVYGPNVFARGRRDGLAQLAWRQINNPLVWVLIVSAVVAMIVDPTGGLKNGLVIFGVVVVNTLIGVVQEYRAGRAIEALTHMVPQTVTAMREGRRESVAAADLVPGDIVELASGDRVPADLRLLAVRNFNVDEAALTGESVPVLKSLACAAAEAALGDRVNMAYAGTLVTQGTGTGVVVETAGRTELGRISALLEEASDLQTPLTQALARIARHITVAIALIAASMVGLGTWRAMSETGVGLLLALQETLIFAIALAVGAIPEGLPAIMTIALAIGVQRMAARRAVVRRLPAVETLGSTTVICTDKTGTLTRNEMTVQFLWTPRRRYTISGVGYAPVGEISAVDGEVPGICADARQLLIGGVLCNDASLTDESGDWRLVGDPTEGALLVAAEKAGMRVETLRRTHHRRDAIPFESEHKFMATLNAAAPGVDAHDTIFMKGAPEVVLARCELRDDSHREAVLQAVDSLAARGMRVLAIAAKPARDRQVSLEIEDTRDGFTLLGLQGMIDPPRPEAISAIAQCREAGITVKMITGDHRATAAAIGRAIGLHADDDVVTGADLTGMSDARMRECVAANNVFARVAPEHKLRLVQALQARGEVVAMTGDGVNDAPALKQANIGVAMGITGTAVSKEAAAIVLADDNFASIAAAVEEGRRVYDNLIKSMAFILPTNLGLALILVAAVAAFPFVPVEVASAAGVVTRLELLLPMLPTQLLWINLVATVALALPLAFEAKEPDLMRRPPRRPDAPVLDAFIIVRTVLVAVLMAAGSIMLFLWEFGRELGDVGRVPGLTRAVVLAEAQTMAVTTVIAFQVFYLLNCRSLRASMFTLGLFANRTVFVGIGAIVLLQLGFIYMPLFNGVFGSAPLGAPDLALSVLVGAIVLPAVSLEKWWRARATAARARRTAGSVHRHEDRAP